MSRSATITAMALLMFVATMFLHEIGHVLGAYSTGGRVVSLELRPGRLSHTLVQPNPSPGLVLWSGFVFGWLAPAVTLPTWRYEHGLIGPFLRATTWFSWLAFGSYLAVAGTERWTDTGQLVAAGWSHPLLVVIGGGVAAIGYARSRAAWSSINSLLAAAAHPWRLAAGWWAALMMWWGVQSVIAWLLGPGSNVR